MNINFDDIRPYYDSEVPEAIERLLQENTVFQSIKQIFPEKSDEELTSLLRGIKTIKDFQKDFIHQLIRRIASKTTDEISISGLKNYDKNTSHLLISNHRDIILDSAFLNVLLHENGIPTTENAIGSNLLIFPWIVDLVKLNKSFVVQRNIPVKQLIVSSQKLSLYIRKQITENRSSIWIAQREGRSKDGSDKTQASLLKMFSMSSDKNFYKAFNELNITPLGLSYEWDPCDLMKVSEVYKKQKNIPFKKSKEDDLNSMLTGISGYKGRVHLAIGEPLKAEIEEIQAATTNKNEQYNLLAEALDRKIHQLYQIYPNNYIAYDTLNNTKEHVEHYSKEEKDKFLNYIDEKLNKVEEDRAVHKQLLLQLYSYPLVNQKKANT